MMRLKKLYGRICIEKPGVLLSKRVITGARMARNSKKDVFVKSAKEPILLSVAVNQTVNQK